MSKFIRNFGIGVLIFSVIAVCRAESKTYQFTGEITQVNKDSITVRRGDDEVRFSLPKSGEKFHTGERITVDYALETKRVTPVREAAGQAAPEDETSQKHLILDDRAFYNAKNKEIPKGKKSG